MSKSYTDPGYPVKRSGEHLTSCLRIPRNHGPIVARRSPKAPGNVSGNAIHAPNR